MNWIMNNRCSQIKIFDTIATKGADHVVATRRLKILPLLVK